MISNIRLPWPEWQITGILGRGGFGTVYEIQKDILGKKEYAAVKVMSIPEDPGEIQELFSRGYDNQSISEHFRGHLEEIVGEYSIMLDLRGHANVVYCDDVKYIQHDDGVGWDVFMKMELLQPLHRVSSSGYSEEETIRLGKDLCNALIFCKQQNIIHRDIKPQNILISRNGSYKLGDFGAAKVSDKTDSATRIGTCEYMAPEVYNAQQYGSRVDIYSLGLVMYWLMNQKCTPFLPLPPRIPTSGEKENARMRRLSGERLPPPVNGSERLKAIVLKACAFDPRERFASPQDMLNALESLSGAYPAAAAQTMHLDVHRRLTFEYSQHPAGKTLSIQVDSQNVLFSVPMDIKNGQTLHLVGRGKRDSATGLCGDLYITIQINPPGQVRMDLPNQPVMPRVQPAPKSVPAKSNTGLVAVGVIAAVVAALVIASILFFALKDWIFLKAADEVHQTTPVTIWEEPPKESDPAVTQHVHSWIEATYDAPKTCTTCGETEGTPLAPESKALWEFDVYSHYGKVWTTGRLAYSDRYHTADDTPDCWSDWSIVGFSSNIPRDNWGNQYDFALYLDGDKSENYYMEIRLDGKYTVFSGVYGCPSENTAMSSYVFNRATNYSKYFEVYGDGKLLYTSALMRHDYAPEAFAIDVTGVRVLRIQYPATKGPNEIATIFDGIFS